MENGVEFHYELAVVRGELKITRKPVNQCLTPHSESLLGLFEIYNNWFDPNSYPHIVFAIQKYCDTLEIPLVLFKWLVDELYQRTLSEHPELFV